MAANTVKLQQDVGKIQGSLDSVGSIAKKVGTAMAAAFTLTAITGAATQILSYAGKINDLAAQTGLSTRSIQEMSHAAKMTGASLESFTNAAFKLGTNLAGGSSSVQGAVEKLGLSYYQLRQQSPDQQFNTITTALGGVQNAQERNQLAVELFGKAAKDILPAISQGYDQLAKAAIVAGDDQIKALDLAGDALDAFWQGLLNVGVELTGGFLIAIREGLRLFEGWVGIVASVKKGMESWGSVMEATGLKALALPNVVNELTVKSKLLPEPIRAITLSLEEQEKWIASNTVQVEKSIESKKAFAKTEENAQKAHEQFAASVKRLDTAEFFVGYKTTVSEASFELEALPSSFAIATNGFAPFKAALRDSGTAVDGFGAKLRDGLMTSLQGIPQMLANALTGGGDIVGALKAIASDVGSKFGQLAATAFGAAGPWGQAIGAAVGSLAPLLFNPLKKLFGIGVNDEIKKANAEIEKLKKQLIDTHGPLSKLQPIAKALGVDFEAAWGHQGQAGLRAFNDLVKEFERRLDDVNREFGDLFTEAQDLGIVLPDAIRASIARMIEMGIITGDTAEQFGRLAEQNDVDFSRMQTLAEQYGIDLRSLGPQFESARLHASAQEIWNDFGLLTRSGADVGGVLLGMKDEIINLALQSVRFGVQIPGNFRPLINSLMESEQLTEDEKIALRQLGDENFGPPIEGQFDRVTAAIERLITRLEQNLFPPLQNVPNPTVTVTTNIDEVIGDVGELAGAINSLPNDVPIEFSGGTNPEGYADGTIGSGSWFQNFGSGRLAVLHGSEAVVRRDQAGAFAAAHGGGGGGAVVTEMRAWRAEAAAREASRDRGLARLIRDEVQKAMVR